MPTAVLLVVGFALLAPSLASVPLAGAQSSTASCAQPTADNPKTTFGPGSNETVLFPYRCSVVPYRALNLSNATSDQPLFSEDATGLNADDTSTQVDLPFGFTFNGTTYASVNVSSNGFLSFTSARHGCCEGQAFLYPGTSSNDRWPPRDDPPNAVVAGYWNDLHPEPYWDVLEPVIQGQLASRSEMAADLVDIGPRANVTAATFPAGTLIDGTTLLTQDVFVVSFENVPHYGDVWTGTGLTAFLASFQIQLYENGTIEVHYEDVASDGSRHTGGIENQAGDLAVVYDQGDWDATETGVRYQPFTP